MLDLSTIHPALFVGAVTAALVFIFVFIKGGASRFNHMPLYRPQLLPLFFIIAAVASVSFGACAGSIIFVIVDNVDAFYVFAFGWFAIGVMMSRVATVVAKRIISP